MIAVPVLPEYRARRAPISRCSGRCSASRRPLRAPSPCRRPRTGRGNRRGRSCSSTNAAPPSRPGRRSAVEQLRNFVVAGLTCSQIAAEIGVTRNAVIGKIHRLGLSPGRPAARRRGPALHAPGGRGRRPAAVFCACVCAERRTSPRATDAAQRRSTATQRCSLLELAQGTCRWPVGDPARRISFSAATKRSPASPTAPAMPAWPTGSRRGGALSERSQPKRRLPSNLPARARSVARRAAPCIAVLDVA